MLAHKRPFSALLSPIPDMMTMMTITMTMTMTTMPMMTKPREMERARVGRRTVSNWEVVSSLQWNEFLASVQREVLRHTDLCKRCSAQQQAAADGSPSAPQSLEGQESA